LLQESSLQRTKRHFYQKTDSEIPSCYYQFVSPFLLSFPVSLSSMVLHPLISSNVFFSSPSSDSAQATNVLSALIDEFGSGGEKAVAQAVIRNLVVPLLQKSS
jgi:hypothetical protein